MYPLLFTTGFLLLMTLFASSELAQYQVGELEKKLYQSQLTSSTQCALESSVATYEALGGHKTKIKTGDGKPDDPRPKPHTTAPFARSLRYQRTRPPNNAKLNFSLLLDEVDHDSSSKEFSFYEIAARLLRRLYGKSSFYEVDMEYHILDALLAQKDKTKEFSFADELASLELGEISLQKSFHRLLQGGYLQQSYPSLLDYITFDREGTRYDQMVNFLFAPEEVLLAFLHHEQVTKDLVEAREELWGVIHKQEEGRKQILQKDALGRKEIKKRAEALFDSTLQHYGMDPLCYKNIFEFSLGKKGNIIYVKDPLTHSITRKKLYKK